MLHRLVFDVTDATSIAQSANVGAWVRAGTDGDQISSTNVGGKEGLDVNIINSLGIDVDLDGVYDVGANPTPDNIGLIAHSRAAAPDNTNQTFRSTGGSPTSDDIVSANVFGLDVNSFLMGYDGTTWDRLTSTSNALDVNLKSQSLTISVSDAALANTAIQQDAASVSVSAALFSSPLANRKYVFIYNNGPKAVYIGASGVTTTNGFPVFPGSLLEARIGASVAVHAIAESGTQNVRLLQAS